MKLLLVSLVTIIALIGWQTPAFAYQEEGPYFDLNLGMMSGKVGSTLSSTPNASGFSFQILDQSKPSQTLLFSLGGGYSINLSNSVSWQIGAEYFQLGDLNARGSTYYNSAKVWTYNYKVRSSGYWITNTFHFDIFTGNLTPVQPFVRLLLGLARNNFYDYNAQEISVPPITFQSGTSNNLAYGSDLGLSYRMSSRQVFNFSVHYWALGKVRSKKTDDISLAFPTNNLNEASFQVGYLLQF